MVGMDLSLLLCRAWMSLLQLRWAVIGVEDARMVEMSMLPLEAAKRGWKTEMELRIL